jgi:hypothetical protein
LPASLPLPLALEPPDATLTETAPLLETLPWTGMPPAPEMTPLLITTPRLELASHEPREVWIETLQLPSKEAASAAVIMAATVITVARIVVARTVGVGIVFMGRNLQRKVSQSDDVPMRTVANQAGADVTNFRISLEGRPHDLREGGAIPVNESYTGDEFLA